MRRYLTAELAADRAAAPRHEHDFIFDISHDFVEVDTYLLSAEQILNIDFAKFGHGHLTVRELINSRQNLDGTP